jgi:uncharacterized protein (TIGR04255 family)
MTGPADRKSYRNPPIEEALVEFRFTDGTYDITVPGKLNELVKAEYPTTREQRVQTVQAVGGGAPTLHDEQRVQFVGADGRQLLLLGRDILGASTLKPYEGWSAFRPRIERGLGAYVEVTAARSIRRIGVRYVNRVVLPPAPVVLDDYFVSGPPRPAGLPKALNAFLSRTEHVYDDGAKLIYTFAGLPALEDGSSAVLVDLDVVSEVAVAVDSAMTLLDELHAREGAAFETIITEKLREVFDAE